MAWLSYKPYVSVAERRAKAKLKLAQMAKKGHVATPVEIAGRKIATTFWGQAWCEHLESYSDFENRLPRGRTYIRNGSVVDMKIEPGRVVALVSGSELYKISIRIKPLAPSAWKGVQSQCAGRIGSLVELLQGRLSRDVMQVVTHRDNGLFPMPKEIEMECSCPDWAGMCKHLAAVLYGVGARLDQQPELLFVLRKVDHRELIAKVGDVARGAKSSRRGKQASIAAENLTDVFGIEIDSGGSTAMTTGRKRRHGALTKLNLARGRQTRARRIDPPETVSVNTANDASPAKKAAKRGKSTNRRRQPDATKTSRALSAKSKKSATARGLSLGKRRAQS